MAVNELDTAWGDVCRGRPQRLRPRGKMVFAEGVRAEATRPPRAIRAADGAKVPRAQPVDVICYIETETALVIHLWALVTTLSLAPAVVVALDELAAVLAAEARVLSGRVPRRR